MPKSAAVALELAHEQLGLGMPLDVIGFADFENELVAGKVAARQLCQQKLKEQRVCHRLAGQVDRQVAYRRHAVSGGHHRLAIETELIVGEDCGQFVGVTPSGAREVAGKPVHEGVGLK